MPARQSGLSRAELRAAVCREPWFVIEFEASRAKEAGAFRKVARGLVTAARRAGAWAAEAAVGDVLPVFEDRSAWSGRVGLAVSLAGSLNQSALQDALVRVGDDLGRCRVSQGTVGSSEGPFFTGWRGGHWRRHWRRNT